MCDKAIVLRQLLTFLSITSSFSFSYGKGINFTSQMFHSCFCYVLIIMHQLLQENYNLHKFDLLKIVLHSLKVLIQLITKQVFQMEDIQL